MLNMIQKNMLYPDIYNMHWTESYGKFGNTRIRLYVKAAIVMNKKKDKNSKRKQIKTETAKDTKSDTKCHRMQYYQKKTDW